MTCRSFYGKIRSQDGAGAVTITVCSTSTQKTKFNKYPGVAQLGARVVWDHQAAGSIPVTRTKNSGFDRNIKAAGGTLRLWFYFKQ